MTTTNPDPQLQAFALITEERAHQQAIGHTKSKDSFRRTAWWVHALMVELGEAADISMSEHIGTSYKGDRFRRALVKIAAVATAALECSIEAAIPPQG